MWLMLFVWDDFYVKYVNCVMVMIDGIGVGDDVLWMVCELVCEIFGGIFIGVYVVCQELVFFWGGCIKVDEVFDVVVQWVRGFGVDMKVIYIEGKDIGCSVCLVVLECNVDFVVIVFQD